MAVELYSGDDELIATTETDESGRYAFEDLEAGEYYLKFELPPGYSVTIQDAGPEDVDSDVDPGTLETDPFSYEPGTPDLTRDMGLVPEARTPTAPPPPPVTLTPSNTPETPIGPTEEPTATLTATATPVIPPDLDTGVELMASFVRVEGECQSISEFEDLLEITIENGEITIRQPSTGDVNRGEIQPDGTFVAESERESYSGGLIFERDAEGTIVRVRLSALNVYEDEEGCVEEFDVSGETGEVD